MGMNRKTCPYAANRITTLQTRQEFNDEGFLTFAETFEVTATDFLPCTETHCGAWRDDHCCYGGETA